MKLTKHTLKFADTGFYSSLVNDYVRRDEKIKPFITDFPSTNSLQKAMEEKQFSQEKRKVLVEVLKRQYAQLRVSTLVQQNIESLLEEKTFTICTAHQPSIFTGCLYFIYKIVHAIKLSNEAIIKPPLGASQDRPILLRSQGRHRQGLLERRLPRLQRLDRRDHRPQAHRHEERQRRGPQDTARQRNRRAQDTHQPRKHHQIARNHTPQDPHLHRHRTLRRRRPRQNDQGASQIARNEGHRAFGTNFKGI